MLRFPYLATIFATASVSLILLGNHFARAQQHGASFDGHEDVDFPACPSVIDVEQAPYGAMGMEKATIPKRFSEQLTT